MTNAEKETIIRWDCEDRVPVLYTADPLQAARWTRFGYHVTVMDRSRDGTARSWSAKGCPGCVRFRRLNDGALVKRTAGGRNLPVQRPSRERAAPEVLLVVSGDFDAPTPAIWAIAETEWALSPVCEAEDD